MESVEGRPQARWVLHLDMDAFFASVEQLTRPTLRGRPVLVGGRGRRGVVAGASYEARASGARSAMPMHMALRAVGHLAVVVPGRHVVYAAASRRVFETVARRVDVVEKLSIDEAFIEPGELRGATPARVRAWCEDLRALIRAETGLVASVGAAGGKQYAKITSDLAKPDGVLLIPAVDQAAVLDPMPVRRLWGIGPVAERRLQRIGVGTIGELAAMDDVEVHGLLGTAVGAHLLGLARGRDDRPVEERAEAKQVSAERTYATDLVGREELGRGIDAAADGALRRLERDGRAARTVTLKLRRADMSILSRSSTLPYTTTDPAILRATAHRLLPEPASLGPVRLVGVGFSGLEDVEQESLFPDLDRDPGPGLSRVDTRDTGGDVGFADGAGGGPATPAGTDAGIGAGTRGWRAGDDVRHPDHGHGWVQGAGLGRVSVRFETRATGPGPVVDLAADDPELVPGDPLDSLAWETPAGEDPGGSGQEPR